VCVCGDITFHGPRQAILYPIVSLRDIGFGARKYDEGLESAMIDLASMYGVEAHPGLKGETGVGGMVLGYLWASHSMCSPSILILI